MAGAGAFVTTTCDAGAVPCCLGLTDAARVWMIVSFAAAAVDDPLTPAAPAAAPAGMTVSGGRGPQTRADPGRAEGAAAGRMSGTSGGQFPVGSRNRWLVGRLDFATGSGFRLAVGRLTSSKTYVFGDEIGRTRNSHRKSQRLTVSFVRFRTYIYVIMNLMLLNAIWQCFA